MQTHCLLTPSLLQNSRVLPVIRKRQICNFQTYPGFSSSHYWAGEWQGTSCPTTPYLGISPLGWLLFKDEREKRGCMLFDLKRHLSVLLGVPWQRCIIGWKRRRSSGSRSFSRGLSLDSGHGSLEM